MTMPDPPGPWAVLIGPKEIYEAVISMKGTVEALVNQHADDRKDLQDHETRIRVLEARRWPVPLVMALAAIGGVIVAAAAVFVTIWLGR